ncbi:MAG: OmpA family protein [Thermodesulfobacteriota bacterium]
MICNKSRYAGIFFLVLSLLLSGCGSKKSEQQPLLPDQDPAAIGQEEPLESRETMVMEGRSTGPMVPVYFDYDSSSVRDDQKERMQLNADFLKDKETVSIRIEGNCDARGSREYNLALGEKRALSVKKYLVYLGVDSERLATLSLGEEKILINGHDEMAWAQNRRADFVLE